MPQPSLSRSSRTARVVAPARADQGILTIRGLRVIVDSDLARLYGVSTKALNQAVKRNADRFPHDFSFRLTAREKKEAVTNCDHLHAVRYSSALPRVFTEHGALMAANMLNSPRPILASIALVRTFVRLRELVVSHADLARRLDELESRYDAQFRVVFDGIRKLMEPAPQMPHKKIGF